MKTFQKKVKECRGRLGLSQKELAQKAGIGIRTLTAYERGECFPQSAQLYKLATALEVSMDYLQNNDAYHGATPFVDEASVEHDFNLERMLAHNRALFAGDTISEEAKDQYFQALLLAYSDCKRAAQEKVQRETERTAQRNTKNTAQQDSERAAQG